MKLTDHATQKNRTSDQQNEKQNQRKFVAVAASLFIMQISVAPFALAQDKTTGPTGLNNSSSSDAWPWMQVNPDSIKPKTSPAAPADVTPAVSPAQSTSAPASPSSTSSGGAFPDVLTNPVGAASEKGPAKPAPEYKLEGEKAKVDVQVKPQEQKREFKEERASAAVVPEKPKTHLLFGRIEELSAGTGAKFPVLKAQTAKMDLSGTTALKATAVDSVYSGQAIKSFPADMNGTFGGILQLSQIHLDPLYYQLDAAEANQTADLMRPGLQGKVNFVFENTGRGVNLEPAAILFQAPMTQARMASQMSQLGSGGLPGMGNMAAMPGMENMMKSMMMSVPYMWKMYFGATQGTGLSGNALQTTLIKNEVRQLSPTVIEQQIISRESDTNPKTGRTRQSYSESVLRFTRYNASQQYVQAAAVDYNSDKRFLRKMVFAGYVTKGAVENTDPMAALGGGRGGMGALGGLGGLGGFGGGGAAGGGMPGMEELQKMLQGGGGQQVPNLKGLFGQ